MDLLGSGREADVYALDSGRVLRRYRRGDDATAEAELMNHLAGLGFPVPRVHEVSGPDMVMERLDGQTMTAAFAAGRIGIAEVATVLAGLHRRLHELPSRSGRARGDRILHRDLHPENVMLTSRGPVVIDWHNAADGPPAVDVCLTAIILAQVAADPGHPWAAVAAEVLTAFLSLAGDSPGHPPDLAQDFDPVASLSLTPVLGSGPVPVLGPGPGPGLGPGSGLVSARDLAGVRGFVSAHDLVVAQGFVAVEDFVAALSEAVEIRRADPALTPEESAGLAATVLPLIRGALVSGPQGM